MIVWIILALFALFVYWRISAGPAAPGQPSGVKGWWLVVLVGGVAFILCPYLAGSN